MNYFTIDYNDRHFLIIWKGLKLYVMLYERSCDVQVLDNDGTQGENVYHGTNAYVEISDTNYASLIEDEDDARKRASEIIDDYELQLGMRDCDATESDIY